MDSWWESRLEKKMWVVYQFPCSYGHVYIGETKRAFETCIKEDKAATRRGETEKLAITEHAWGQQHPILWKETIVLDQAKNNTTLLIKESLHIHLTNFQLINRDEGVIIPECWQPVLDHVTMTVSTHATPHHAMPGNWWWNNRCYLACYHFCQLATSIPVSN